MEPMGHGHSHGGTNFNRAFAIGAALNLAFVITEAVFGLLANSLALLADAGHNLSDVLGLLLAWGAGYLSKRGPTQRRTYGYRRSTILAALMNALSLLIAIGAIAWEAVGRLMHPTPVVGVTVIVVAAIGVVVNTVTALLFLSGRRSDLNIRGAFLHMAADAAVSLGVVVAGIIIGVTGWAWIDPATSLLIAAVIAISTWGLLRHSFNLAMDAVPPSIDLPAVRDFLEHLPGVSKIHDLHIWGMSTTESALTVHLVKPEAVIDDNWLAGIVKELHDRFHIEHSTIQLENGRSCQSCNLEPEEII